MRTLWLEVAAAARAAAASACSPSADPRILPSSTSSFHNVATRWPFPRSSTKPELDLSEYTWLNPSMKGHPESGCGKLSKLIC
jgi:hypothetical protein